MLDLLPKQREYAIDLSKPLPRGWQYIGCVCEFADECQVTHEDLQKGVKCKAYWTYKVKSSKEGHESGSEANWSYTQPNTSDGASGGNVL